MLTTKRACGPNKQAIKEATTDIIYGKKATPVTITLARPDNMTEVKIIGLNVGWHNPTPMTRNGRGGFEFKTELLPTT